MTVRVYGRICLPTETYALTCCGMFAIAGCWIWIKAFASRCIYCFCNTTHLQDHFTLIIQWAFDRYERSADDVGETVAGRLARETA